MKSILSLLIFLTLGIAETILIPEDYQTIQEGIDASVDGDTVLVAEYVVDRKKIKRAEKYIDKAKKLHEKA